MRKTCFLVAAFIWASALLFIPQPCHADLVEISDQDLDGITGQAGILIPAEDGIDSGNGVEASAGNSHGRNENGMYPEKGYLPGDFLQDWIFDDIHLDNVSGNAVHPASGNVWIESSGFQSEMELGEGSAGIFGIYDFRAQFSGNVHVYSLVD